MGAFTLIELIAVMAIILILAGLILGIAGHAQHDSAVRRAQAEVKAMESAIEAYKIDNGAYPRDASTTDKLNSSMNFDPLPSGSSGSLYQNSSQYLYQCLSGFDPKNPTSIITKPYMEFTPGQLAVGTGGSATTPTPTSPYMFIVDPFGYSYGYSTIYQAVLDTPSATPDPTKGYNPTFDLWSTAGYSQAAGHGTPSNMAAASPAAAYSMLWVKNW